LRLGLIEIIVVKVNIPVSERKKALLVIDVQDIFMNKHVEHIPGRIVSLIKEIEYSIYVEALFHAEAGSIWDRQQQWTGPKNGHLFSMPELSSALGNKRAVYLGKETRSAFKGEFQLHQYLQDNDIKEVHIVGVDTSDCVLATAHEAFDLGYFTFVIEECCQVAHDRTLHEKAVDILRFGKLTNNSCIEDIHSVTVDLD